MLDRSIDEDIVEGEGSTVETDLGESSCEEGSGTLETERVGEEGVLILLRLTLFPKMRQWNR